MKWTPGTIERKHVWDEGLFTLTVRAPEVETFQPGQFLQLGLDLPDGHLHRPYSVASPHGELLDFFIVLVEDGRLTPRLWNMREGDQLDVSQKAAGSFTLGHCPQASHLWLIGTGTGLAPYIAMLRTEEPWQRYQKIIVVHGVRHAPDLAYQDELARYTARGEGGLRISPSSLGKLTPPVCWAALPPASRTAHWKQPPGRPFPPTVPSCCAVTRPCWMTARVCWPPEASPSTRRKRPVKS